MVTGLKSRYIPPFTFTQTNTNRRHKQTHACEKQPNVTQANDTSMGNDLVSYPEFLAKHLQAFSEIGLCEEISTNQCKLEICCN